MSELVAVLVDGGGAVPPCWTTRRTVESLPEEPFGLGHLSLKLHVRLTDAAGSALVVEAAARGVPVVVEVGVGVEPLAELLDQLRRIGTVEDRRCAGKPSPPLGRQHRALLDLLAGGATLTAAAAKIGMSRRTATRRLAEARDASGVGSAVEALIVSARHRR